MLGPLVIEAQNWISASPAGKALQLALAHNVALYEAKATAELVRQPLTKVRTEMPFDAVRNLALAEKYRNALEVLQQFSRESDRFITTNLPISHA